MRDFGFYCCYADDELSDSFIMSLSAVTYDEAVSILRENGYIVLQQIY